MTEAQITELRHAIMARYPYGHGHRSTNLELVMYQKMMKKVIAKGPLG